MASFQDAKRIVVKVGSSTLTYETGMINIRRVEKLVKVLADPAQQRQRNCAGILRRRWLLASANWA